MSEKRLPYADLRRYRALLWGLLLLYLAALLWLFLFKDLSILELEHARFSWENFGLSSGQMNLVPGTTLLYYLTFREKYSTGALNIGGNLLGFLPLGVLLPLCARPFRRAESLGRAAIGLSALIELFQFFSGGGDCDIDDLLINGAGALIGFWMLRWFGRRLKFEV